MGDSCMGPMAKFCLAWSSEKEPVIGRDQKVCIICNYNHLGAAEIK